MNGYIPGVDVSHWNKNINWLELYNGGIRFAFVKLTGGSKLIDSGAADHISKARNHGILVGGYHWADPTVNDALQTDLFLSQLNKYGIKAGAIDSEQYWQNWAEFYNHSITTRISPERISQNAYNLYTDVLNENINATVYTRYTFMTDYAQPMLMWMKEVKGWYAQYPYSSGRITTSWNEVLNTVYKPIRQSPTLPINFAWRFWQFSGDKFILPGTGGSPIDLNFFHGTIEELKSFFNSTIPQTPPETAPAISIILTVQNEVNIRELYATNSRIYGVRKPGDRVTVEKIVVTSPSQVWVKDKLGWSAAVYNGVLYMM